MSAAPPLLLLHGCGGTARATFVATGWVAALQARGREVWVPDLPGHGLRQPSHRPQDYADLAGDLLRDLPSGPFAAVGYSLGAKLVLELAARCPGRITRAVLGGLGDNLFGSETVAPVVATALESGTGAATPPAVLAFLREWDPVSNDRLAIAAVLRRPANPVFTPERLRGLRLPLLIVNGAQDPVAASCGTLAAALPQARVELLAGVAHFELPRDERFRQLAMAFLQNDEAAT